MARFEVVEVKEDGTTERVASLPIFNSGKDAKFHANQMAMMDGKKYQPRPIADEVGGHKQDWLVSIPLYDLAESKPLVNNHIKQGLRYYKDPMYDPRQRVVRYFTDEQSKKLSRSVAIDVLGFIRNIFSYDYSIGEKEKAFWLKVLEPNFWDDMEFKITSDVEEILSVYQNGPSSCMTHDEDYYVDKQHPVSVYGGENSDFALAYLHMKDKPNSVKARGIICPSRKIYGRIYGNAEALMSYLHDEGYHYGLIHEWQGLKFRTKWIDGMYLDPEDHEERYSAEGYHAPYLDMASRLRLELDHKHDEYGSGWFIMDNDGEYDACLTNGTAEYDSYDSYNCQECGKECHNGDRYHCFLCRVKLYGIDASSGYPLDQSTYGALRYVKAANTGHMVVEGRNSARKCRITKKILEESALPRFFGVTYSEDEAKVELSEHWHILRNAYLPQTGKVEDGGDLHQEVPAAA